MCIYCGIKKIEKFIKFQKEKTSFNLCEECYKRLQIETPPFSSRNQKQYLKMLYEILKIRRDYYKDKYPIDYKRSIL